MTTALGVLVPVLGTDPGVPEDRPLGRAALRLEADGVPILFASSAEDGLLVGVRARPGAWVPARAEGVACYDRYPSRSRPVDYRDLVARLEGLPLANPPALVDLCADKLACQETLADLPAPDVVSDPDTFSDQLSTWGSGFLKPRFGAFGRGVRRVVPGDLLPARGEGAVPGVDEPLFLQRAVPPPRGWAGVACRVLVQRIGPDTWHVETPVARRHRTDPVVNAARGAAVVPLATAAPGCEQAVRDLAEATARRLAQHPGGALLVEIGVDIVLDEHLQPWLIEVNSRPRGRLEALAAADPRWLEAHVAACARPLRYLASRFL